MGNFFFTEISHELNGFGIILHKANGLKTNFDTYLVHLNHSRIDFLPFPDHFKYQNLYNIVPNMSTQANNLAERWSAPFAPWYSGANIGFLSLPTPCRPFYSFL